MLCEGRKQASTCVLHLSAYSRFAYSCLLSHRLVSLNPLQVRLCIVPVSRLSSLQRFSSPTCFDTHRAAKTSPARSSPLPRQRCQRHRPQVVISSSLQMASPLLLPHPHRKTITRMAHKAC